MTYGMPALSGFVIGVMDIREHDKIPALQFSGRDIQPICKQIKM